MQGIVPLRLQCNAYLPQVRYIQPQSFNQHPHLLRSIIPLTLSLPNEINQSTAHQIDSAQAHRRPPDQTPSAELPR